MFTTLNDNSMNPIKSSNPVYMLYGDGDNSVTYYYYADAGIKFFYTNGDEFSTKGLFLQIAFTDGTYYYMPVTIDMVSGFSVPSWPVYFSNSWYAVSSYESLGTVTITYGGTVLELLVFYYDLNSSRQYYTTFGGGFNNVYSEFENYPDMYVGEELPIPEVLYRPSTVYMYYTDNVVYSSVKDKFYLNWTNFYYDGDDNQYLSNYYVYNMNANNTNLSSGGPWLYQDTLLDISTYQVSNSGELNSYNIIVPYIGAFVFHAYNSILIENYLSTGQYNNNQLVTFYFTDIVFNTQISDTLFSAIYVANYNSCNYDNNSYGIKFYLELPQSMSNYYNSNNNSYSYTAADIDSFRIYYIDPTALQDVEIEFHSYDSSFFYEEYQSFNIVTEQGTALAWENTRNYSHGDGMMGSRSPITEGEFFVQIFYKNGTQRECWTAGLFYLKIFTNPNRIIVHSGGSYNDHAPSYQEVKNNEKWYNFFVDGLFALEDMYKYGVDLGSTLPLLITAVNNAISDGDQLLIDITMQNLWDWFVENDYEGIVNKIIDNDELSPSKYRGDMWFSHSKYDDNWYIVGRGEDYAFGINIVEFDNAKLVIDVPRFWAIINAGFSPFEEYDIDEYSAFTIMGDYFQPILRITLDKVGSNYVFEMFGFSVSFYISPIMVNEYNIWSFYK
jgi:hypothetical protein